MAQKRIIDRRKKEKFMIDDKYLNGQAKVCGWQATLAYISLCRHSSKDQECFPSIELISKELKISRTTVIKGLDMLERFNVIEVKKTRAKDGKWLNNTYILIDKSEWIYEETECTHEKIDSKLVSLNPKSTTQTRPEENLAENKADSQVNVVDSDISQVHVRAQPSPRQSIAESTSEHSRVHGVDCKETHTRKHIEGNTYKETHLATPEGVADTSEKTETENIKKQIPLLINLFKPINPSFEKLFANRTQRAVLERMIKKYTFENVEKIIKALPEIVIQPFAPSITTPCQLEDNLGKLKIFIKRNENKGIIQL